jgi:hypothetical protein
MEEIWKRVTGYENYEVSNLGRVRSIERLVKHKNGRTINFKGRILKPNKTPEKYLYVQLYKDKKSNTLTVHKVVAITFLNLTPNGHSIVVNHINHDREDNRVENLELITQRENTNKLHLKSSSKYVGVTWKKQTNKWNARIVIDGKLKHLGYFSDEYEAHLEYQKALNNININE